MSEASRYDRQMLLPGVGETGQARLRGKTALVVGLGALGAMSAELLVRAGVGRVILVDRDWVEWTNLQRQVLYTEADARAAEPKAVAAKKHLSAINSAVQLDAYVMDFHAGNGQRLAEQADVIVDGLDNVLTRYLLNDYAVMLGKPYVYGGAVGTGGRVMAVLPRTVSVASGWERAGVVGPCLRCVFGEPPSAGALATCDTAGVLGPVVTTVASVQAGEALKILLEAWADVSMDLLAFDLWESHWQSVNVRGSRDEECPCCGRGEFDFANGKIGANATVLCGRNAVQVSGVDVQDGTGERLDLSTIASKLAGLGIVKQADYFARASWGDGEDAMSLTVFADGRAVVQGTQDEAEAKSLYAKWVGQ